MLVYTDSTGRRRSFRLLSAEPVLHGRCWYPTLQGREWTTIGHGWSLVCPD